MKKKMKIVLVVLSLILIPTGTYYMIQLMNKLTGKVMGWFGKGGDWWSIAIPLGIILVLLIIIIALTGVNKIKNLF